MRWVKQWLPILRKVLSKRQSWRRRTRIYLYHHWTHSPSPLTPLNQPVKLHGSLQVSRKLLEHFPINTENTNLFDRQWQERAQRVFITLDGRLLLQTQREKRVIIPGKHHAIFWSLIFIERPSNSSLFRRSRDSVRFWLKSLPHAKGDKQELNSDKNSWKDKEFWSWWLG